MNPSALALLSLGFLYGLRHALDPDHMVAVSTIVSEHKSVARSSLIGTFWGLGHTASLFLAGLAVLLLRVSISRRVELYLEMAVAAMLVILGTMALVAAGRTRGLELHAHPHSHDGELPHKHLHIHKGQSHEHRHSIFRLGRKPFIVGLVHGMAGSAAVTLAALTTVPSIVVGLGYIGVFGLGSVGGMLLLSALIGLPFAVTARRFSAINTWARLLAGAFSVAFGLMLALNLIREISDLNH